MKKISIITILDVTNIGTYLQAFALGSVLQRFNVVVEFVHYVRPLSSLKEVAVSRWKKNQGGARGMAAVLYGFIVDQFSLKICKKFLRDRMLITKRYNSFCQLLHDPPHADIYMTGSDQVWNPLHNRGVDKSYFLDYAEVGAPRCAYAASIGTSSLEMHHAEEMLDLLKQYKIITVREKSGQKLLEEMGFRDVSTVLDPTLLLDRSEWEIIAKHARFKKSEPYIIVYSVENENKIIVSNVAKSIADHLDLKVYFISPRWFSSRPQCDYCIYFASPLDFLSVFINAEFAVVSSFHGTAFAVNFNIPFVCVNPGRFSERMVSLLAIVGLQSKLVEDVPSAIFEARQYYDWRTANEALRAERDKSISVLKSMISDSACSTKYK